jgi:hypothetical protein
MTKGAAGLLSGITVGVLSIAILAPIILSSSPWPVASRNLLATSRRSGGIGRIDPSLTAFGHASLARMEAWAFAAILLLSFPGTGRAMEAIREFTGSYGLEIPAVSYIIALNVIIGLKVGAGVALTCILMLGGESE